METNKLSLNQAIATLYMAARKANLSADEHDQLKEIYDGVMGLINTKPAPAPEV